MNHATTDVKTDEQDDTNTRSAVEIMRDSQSLYEKKNQDYGDSWRLVGKTLAMWVEHQGIDELTIPVNEYTMNSWSLFTRRLDKMIREFNGWFMLEEGDDLQVDEAIAETHQDDVPYSAMHCQLAEEYAAMDYSDFSGGVDG